MNLKPKLTFCEHVLWALSNAINGEDIHQVLGPILVTGISLSQKL